MTKLLPETFLNHPNKRISLMGMSGVGKTYLAKLLPRQAWFHYSVDYRIGTRYLGEDINDFLKIKAMSEPLLADLLRNNAIYIHSNLSFDNLAPLSAYLGMVGNLEKGGLSLEEFQERLTKHRQAEINATKDAMLFIKKAKKIYGYPHFICDTSGSLCEIDAPEVWEELSQNTLLVYLKATEEMKTNLIARSQSHPKPLYYQTSFLLEKISDYCVEKDLSSWKNVNPKEFAQWVFPRLVDHRVDLYQKIADQYGVTIEASSLYNVKSEYDLLTLLKESPQ